MGTVLVHDDSANETRVCLVNACRLLMSLLRIRLFLYTSAALAAAITNGPKYPLSIGRLKIALIIPTRKVFFGQIKYTKKQSIIMSLKLI